MKILVIILVVGFVGVGCGGTETASSQGPSENPSPPHSQKCKTDQDCLADQKCDSQSLCVSKHKSKNESLEVACKEDSDCPGSNCLNEKQATLAEKLLCQQKFSVDQESVESIFEAFSGGLPELKSFSDCNDSFYILFTEMIQRYPDEALIYREFSLYQSLNVIAHGTWGTDMVFNDPEKLWLSHVEFSDLDKTLVGGVKFKVNLKGDQLTLKKLVEDSCALYGCEL